MPLEFEAQSTASEQRYDAETMQKIMQLATELQGRQHETFTPSDMERIGSEVGLQPGFVREAIARLQAEELAKQESTAQAKRGRGAWIAAWWATGWAMMPLMENIGKAFHSHDLGEAGVVLALAVYIGGGILLSAGHRDERREERRRRREERRSG